MKGFLSFASWIRHSKSRVYSVVLDENITSFGNFPYGDNPRRGNLHKFRIKKFGVKYFSPFIHQHLLASRQALWCWD